MNERIKELMLKAEHGNYGRIEFAEAFAELIVQECCNVLQGEDIRYGGYGYNQGFLHKKIKQHFGVED